MALTEVATGAHRTVTHLPTGPWDFVVVFGGDVDDDRLIRRETTDERARTLGATTA